MLVKYAIYGAFFGWMLMPRWQGQEVKIPVAVFAYMVALGAVLVMVTYLHYERQTWLFAVGMAIHVALYAATKLLGRLTAGKS